LCADCQLDTDLEQAMHPYMLFHDTETDTKKSGLEEGLQEDPKHNFQLFQSLHAMISIETDTKSVLLAPAAQPQTKQQLVPTSLPTMASRKNYIRHSTPK
jgi:hypothetical protein